MESEGIKKLTQFFYEMGSLKNIRRSHQAAFAKDDSDNIASHSFLVAIIGYFLAKELNADCDKVLKMCLFHDMEEIRSGDQNWINKKYVKVFEEEIREDQLKELPHSQEIAEAAKEYDKRETAEAKIAKDADLLGQILALRDYEYRGLKEAGNWLNHGNESEYEKLLSTDLAKKIAKEAKSQSPHDWWQNFWTNNRR
jgi:putative hydrolase of HD superfamily